jgi:tetratricopeptide (TPR) repeat protein
MYWASIVRKLALAGPLSLALAIGVPLKGAEAAAAPSLATTPATPPKNNPLPFTVDNWQSYMQLPTAPTRSHAFQGDDGNAARPKPQATPAPATPIAIVAKPLETKGPVAVKPKPGSDDDRLATIAIEDRDFFAALAKNPETWPEAERDRRAQVLHDKYWLYLAEYPNDANAAVLYGKLLSHTGQRDAAFAAFVRADALDQKIAAVKQQLANYLAENGSYAAALEMFRKAVALAPGEPLYHYEIGELLNFFYEGFLHDKIFDEAELNKTMEMEFGYAAALAPKTTAFAWRHALCYYDMLDPDWNAALKAWDDLAQSTTEAMEQDVIRLHRARILLELQRYDDARKVLAQPVQKNLEPVQAALVKRLEAATAPLPPAEAPPAATTPPAS